MTSKNQCPIRKYRLELHSIKFYKQSSISLETSFIFKKSSLKVKAKSNLTFASSSRLPLIKFYGENYIEFTQVSTNQRNANIQANNLCLQDSSLREREQRNEE